MNHRFLYIFLLAFFFTACEEDSDSGRRIDRPTLQSSGPTFRIRLMNAQGLAPGDTLLFEVKPDKVEDRISKIEVGGVDDAKPFFETEKSTFSIPSNLIGGGEVRLKFTARFESGERSTRYKEARILASDEPNRFRFEVVAKYPHDVSAYTQGFLVHKGFVYEGTGNYGESRLRRVDLTTGNVLMEKPLDNDIFGEGITIYGDKLFQLTYKSGRGFVYDAEDFSKIDEFVYNTKTGEGWGLTHNDTCLIMSDGSSFLYFLDPDNFEIRKRLNVYDHNGNLNNLNELEYRDGVIYANVYTQPFILAIDASSGRVTDVYVASGIVDRSEANSEMDVLNGIAINPATGNLLLTGKYWSRIYEVRSVPY